MIKTCPDCGTTGGRDLFYTWQTKGRVEKISRQCKSCRNKRVTDRTRECQKAWKELKGSMCCKCGYDKALAALDWHHRDPTEKEHQASQLFHQTMPTSLSKTAVKCWLELFKCDLVCANCHREIHDELNYSHLKSTD